MLKNKKVNIVFALVLFILLTACGSIENDIFNEDNAYKHIVELSSKEYQGRLPGTEGNIKAAKYIAEEFGKIKLNPGGKDGSYYQPFIAISPILESPTKFQVLDSKGNFIKEYKLRKDFAEVTSDYAKGDSVRETFRLVNSLNNINAEQDNIILTCGDIHNNQNSKLLIQNGVKAVITPTIGKLRGLNKDLLIKSVYIGEKQNWQTEGKFIHLVVTQDVFSELMDFSQKGYLINIDLNLTFPKIQPSNVIGYISGNDKKLKDEAIIISAHFDHVGTDPDGTVFYGALDNASGIGTLLEIARAIKSTGKTPKRTIIFAAFNAEESGLQGSEHYTESPLLPLKGTKVINIDMVGSKEDVKLEIDMSPTTPNLQAGKDLMIEIGNLAEVNDIEHTFNQYSDNSDHWSFNYKGVPAVTVTHPSMTRIHTTEDDIFNIDKKRLEQAGELLINCIDYYAFKAKDVAGKKLTEEQMSTLKIVPIYLLIIALIILLFVLMIKNPRIRKIFKGKHILSTILFIVLLLSILVFNSIYQYEEATTTFSNYRPWENKVNIIKKDNLELCDIEADDEITYLIRDSNGIKEIIVDNKGKIIQDNSIELLKGQEQDIKLYNGEIYYIDNQNLCKICKTAQVSEVIIKDIKGYNIIGNEGKNYIIAYNDEGIKLKGKDLEKMLDQNNVDGVLADIDRRGRFHIIYKERINSGESKIKYILLDTNGSHIATKDLYDLKEDSKLSFGIDKTRGYIFFKKDSGYYYLSFYLGNRENFLIKREKIELHDSHGALIKINGLPYISKRTSSEENNLHAIITGKIYSGKNYLYYLKFNKGKLNEKEIIHESQKENLLNPILYQNGYDKYIGWLEGKDGSYRLRMTSSNPQFGANAIKDMILVRLGNIVQNILLAILIAIIKLYWLIPGFIFLVIWKYVKKNKWLEKGIAVYIAVSLNVITQILTFNMPNLFGLNYENIIISIIIGMVSAGLVIIYRYERSSFSFFRLFLVFTIVNILFVSTLYAPYTLEGGLERLKQIDFFRTEEKF